MTNIKICLFFVTIWSLPKYTIFATIWPVQNCTISLLPWGQYKNILFLSHSLSYWSLPKCTISLPKYDQYEIVLVFAVTRSSQKCISFLQSSDISNVAMFATIWPLPKWTISSLQKTTTIGHRKLNSKIWFLKLTFVTSNGNKYK